MALLRFRSTKPFFEVIPNPPFKLIRVRNPNTTISQPLNPLPFPAAVAWEKFCSQLQPLYFIQSEFGLRLTRMIARCTFLRPSFPSCSQSDSGCSIHR